MKNTHFIPCNKLYYHKTICAYNVVLIGQDKVLLAKYNSNSYSPLIPDTLLNELQNTSVLEIGSFRNEKCGVIEVNGELNFNSEIFEIQAVRESLKLFTDKDEKNALSRAIKFNRWAKLNKFCGVCGTELISCENETAKVCPNCKNRIYPVIAPAIITAVTNGNKILLAHNHRFREGLYSLIAGFVESGETLEQAVKREVFEEAGIQVTNIKYFGSQPWPFPNSLMMGFTAEYVSGEIIPELNELSDVQWFDMDKLPLIPTDETIARQLIDYVVKNK